MSESFKRENTVDYNIKAAWHAISRLYNQRGMENDITTSIGFVLLNIAPEGTPATKIAPQMGLESRSLTRMLKSMEEKKLIYKKPDAIDKRSVRIYLTEEGKRKRDFSRNGVITFNKVVRDHIDVDKLAIFMEVIGDINKLLEQEKIKQQEIINN